MPCPSSPNVYDTVLVTGPDLNSSIANMLQYPKIIVQHTKLNVLVDRRKISMNLRMLILPYEILKCLSNTISSLGGTFANSYWLHLFALGETMVAFVNCKKIMVAQYKGVVISVY